MAHGTGVDPPGVTGDNFVKKSTKLEAPQGKSVLLVGCKTVLHAALPHFFFPSGGQGLVGARRRGNIAARCAKSRARVTLLSHVIKDSGVVCEIAKKTVVISAFCVANGRQCRFDLGQCQKGIKVVRAGVATGIFGLVL